MLDVTRTSPTGVDRALQLRLTELNHWRFEPGLPGERRASWRDMADLLEEEVEFLERERAAAVLRAPPKRPTDAKRFIEWFESLKETGPGQGDPLFPWLENEATLDEMKWFLTQEVAGEAGFEDLTALTQLKFPTRPKLELARNYWDEMGRGNPKAMHGPLLGALADHLRADAARREDRRGVAGARPTRWPGSPPTGSTPTTRSARSA